MSLPITGQAQGLFQQISQKSGTPQAFSSGWHNEMLVSELLPRYAAAVLAGSVFSASQTAPAALTAAGTTTTGIVLFNPLGSNKNLILLDATVGVTPVTLATVHVDVILGGAQQLTGALTLTTSITIANNLIGSATSSVAKAGTGSNTIANTPLGLRIIGSWESTVLTTSGGATASAAILKDEIAGAVIVPPGALVCTYGIGTVADGTVEAALTWMELPV